MLMPGSQMRALLPELIVFVLWVPLLIFIEIGKFLMSWGSNGVFASFYLREVSYVWDNCRSLGPIVAGGGVLDVTSRTQPHQT